MNRSFVKRLSMIAALLVLALFFTLLTEGSFLTPRNLSNLFRQVAVNGILSVGMTFIILTGGIDLSIGSVMALTGVIAGYSQANWGWSERGFAGAVSSGLLALLSGMLIGLINGTFVGKIKIPAFVITLGMMVIARGLALILSNGQAISPIGETISEFGGGYVPILPSQTAILAGLACYLGLLWWNQKKARSLGLATEKRRFLILKALGALVLAGGCFNVFAYKGLPIPVFVLLFILLAAWVVLTQTRIGRYVYAIGGNAEAARLAGVPVVGVTVFTYLLMSTLTALAGIITVGRLNAAIPTEGQLMELDAIAAVVIGGTSLMGGSGSVLGSLIGALIIGTMNNGMSLMNVPAFYQMVIKGMIIILAVTIDRRQGE